MDTWVQEVSCLSRHHQGLGSMAVSLAQERGFEVDETSLDAQRRRMAGTGAEGYDAILQGDFAIDASFGLGYMLLGLAAAEYPADDRTDAMAHDIAGIQADRGAWGTESHRPPLEDSPVTVTALSVRALALFGPEGRAPEIERRLRRARAHGSRRSSRAPTRSA